MEEKKEISQDSNCCLRYKVHSYCQIPGGHFLLVPRDLILGFRVGDSFIERGWATFII